MSNDERLGRIFENRLSIDFISNKHLQCLKLLGGEIDCPIGELALIVFDIEKEFNINIPEEILLNGGFETYANILTLINKINENF